MWDAWWQLAKWQGCGGLASTDSLERLGLPLVGLGMWDFGGDDPEKACSVWGCWDGPVKHFCLWDWVDGPGKHWCLCRSCCCWTGGKFKWIGCTCSPVLWYFLPWASMMYLCGAGAFSIMVPGMYSSSTGDLKRTSWPGGSSDRAQTLCDLLNWLHWVCFWR